ncbi:MAG TPA: hypothetical protein VK469_18325 [Candidatus Kapabacteria bacterium]|nr:hypothetical protein [Candidatus Kapabacteria bacterium]
MPTFKLYTNFSNEDLEIFFLTGTNIVVAKSFGSHLNVAWVVYRPLNKNEMTWEENYGIYASNTELTDGATIFRNAQTPFPAEAGKIYPMSPSGAFGWPSSGGLPFSYGINNDYANEKGHLTFGLYQNANVNGEDLISYPVIASSLLYKFTAIWTPLNTVYLWTQAQVKSSMVVTNITSQMTQVTFSILSPEISLQYDRASGKFIPGPNTVLPSGVEVQHPKVLL